MRSRAGILPFPGDPFLLNYWLHLFDTVWGDEIDKLYIYLNSSIEPVMVDYIRDLCAKRPKVNLQYNNVQVEHGEAIKRTLDIVEEKYIMLIEDDGFIFKKGMVDECFKKLENGSFDVVGSKRGSCAMEILLAAKAKWGLNYEGEGDQGPNFWPCYFFCAKELLLKTDQNYGAKAWKEGEKIEALDYTVTDPVAYSDTFVNTSLQVRNLVPIERIAIVPQYHGHPEDLDHAEKGQYLFDGNAPWTHIGSLSSGVGGILKDDQNRSLSRRLIDPPAGATILPTQWCTSDMEHKEFERRVQWWTTFYEFAVPNEKIVEFYDLYGKACQQIISQFGLSINNIRMRQKVYKEKLGL